MKKIKWIMLALVLCLGLVGGAYAAWTDTIIIGGTATTGDIDVKVETLIYPDAAGTIDGVTHTAVISPDGQTVTITLDNLYPGFLADIQFGLKNYGSRPVQLVAYRELVNSGDLGGNGLVYWDRNDYSPFDPNMILVPGVENDSFSIVLEATDDIEQNETYTFSLEFDYEVR